MTLCELADYEDIVIQCHDVPDADAIASGFALLCYIRSRGSDARLVYGGKNLVTKPNLVMMLKLLRIPLEHVEELPACGLLVTVDCQYGAGNVRKFPAEKTAVFDHHRPEIPEGPDVLIRPALGSCSTLIWDLLRKENFDFDASPEVFNALFYGLFTDTNGFAEMRHPLDRDLSEFMNVDWPLVKKLKNSALTVDELGIVADALSSPRLVGNIGVLRSKQCDPNILGFTSDIAQQVERFDCCVVYCPISSGVKISIRSTVREIMANDLAVFIHGGYGSGGGNLEKAGGYISFAGIERVSPGSSPDDFMLSRIVKYQDNFDFIYSGTHDIDFASMPRFKKLPIPLGFARTEDMFPAGTHICVRTLEGDVDTASSPDTYIMIGVEGETYPIKREKFERGYIAGGSGSDYRPKTEYEPSIIDKMTGKKKNVLSFARPCVPRDEKIIRARLLSRDAKVFSDWDVEKYFLGRTGDYLAAPETDFRDVYIIKGEIFGKTYVPVV
jgi:phosphoglycolate phosphatase